LDRPPVVLILFGTRPEAIKLAPVAHALRNREEQVSLHVVSTGQHDDLLDDALASLDMVVEENLEIMQPDQDLYDIGIGCLDGLRATLRRIQPDVILVQGDTATVFFGSLAGFYERARVGHVEAGLRSGDKWAPFPEEIYRRLTDVVSDYYFAPTAGAKANLVAEGVPEECVNVTGNTVIDAVQALAGTERPVENVELRECLESKRRFVLITAHRRESFGDPMREAFGALRTLAEEHPDDLFVYPVHPNPNVRAAADEKLAGIANFRLIDPLSYSDLVRALSQAWITITDSGGIQEEAPTFGVPVLVMRELTERPEGVEAGAAALVGTSREKILERGRELLNDEAARQRMAGAGNPYGDGRAGERIADILFHRLTGASRRTEDWR
jgi:UDP-N-acetylglucosamine 2-epimerase (non-hydrolysing)